jgi:AcrR family transcriptional regulator
MAARTLAERTHAVMRDEALTAAAQLLLAGGYRGLRLQDVADDIGVSRQTLYNEFGSKRGLAAALVLRLTERFLDNIEAALGSEDDLYGAWVAAVRLTIETAAADPLLKTLLTGLGSEEMLPLLTTESEPVVQAARDRASAYLLDRWPDLRPADVTEAAEVATRLAISHIVVPLHPAEFVASQVATVVVRYLGHEPPPTE